MLTSEIRIDVNNHTAPDIYARIGESNTRRVKFYPGYYDPDGNFVGLSTDEESIRVEFRMVKPDNTFVVVDLPISIVDDPITFRVMLTPEMCQVGGVGYYDIRIGDSGEDDEFLYTAHGRFIIDDNMLTDEMIESVAAVNGLIFPDDFLTSADLDDYVKEEELTDYATKEYVDDAISGIHNYNTTVLWTGSVDASTYGDLINLSDNVSNYDALIIVCGKATWDIPHNIFTVVMEIGGHYVGNLNGEVGANWYYTSDTSLTVTSMNNSNRTLYKAVIGLKF